MLSLAISSVFLTVSYLAGAAFAVAPIQITNKANFTAKSCENFTLTWTGGKAPYTVQIHYAIPAGQGPSMNQSTGTLIEVDTMIVNVNTTTYTTRLNVPPNAQNEFDLGVPGNVRFGVWDSQLNRTEFPLVNQKISAGADDSCLPKLSAANDTRPVSIFHPVALLGPGKSVPECSVSNFQTIGLDPSINFPTSMTFQTLGLANDVTMQLFNILSTNVSMKLPFPEGTSFTTAAGAEFQVVGDIERTITAGTSKCAAPF